MKIIIELDIYNFSNISNEQILDGIHTNLKHGLIQDLNDLRIRTYTATVSVAEDDD